MAGKYAPAELDDIEAAFEHIKGQKRSISKSAIYTEIEQHPDNYPYLSHQPRMRVLTVISYYMNLRYELFTKNEGKQVRNAVWNLTQGKA